MTRRQIWYLVVVVMGIDRQAEPARFWGAYRYFRNNPVMSIPERSFLRATVDVNTGRYYKAMRQVIDRAIFGGAAYRQGLEAFGQLVSSDVQRFISRGIPPANSSLTIANKRSATPLIDTGRLRQSITYKVKKGVRR